MAQRTERSVLNTPDSTTEPSQLFRKLRENAELLQQIEAWDGSELAIQQQLRKTFDGSLVAAAMSLTESRRKAATLLPHAEKLWLTRVALEQATAWRIAKHKASRFPSGRAVLDVCSGIGVDSAALLNRGPVTSVDSDPVMALFLRWNLEVWRQSGQLPDAHSAETIVADATTLELSGQLLHVDPDRRCGRDRPVKRLEQYSPNLDWMQSTIETAAGGAFKLGPASNFIQKFPGCEIELISLNGECREATVWFGELAGDKPFRATALPSGESLSADPLDSWCEVAAEPQTYLFDPDPAVVRAGLVDTVGEMHNLRRLDSAEEYLTGDATPDTSFARCFRVIAVFPNNLKHLKKFLRAQPAREYEVKCRHIRIDAASVRRQLPTGNGPPRVIFFARVDGRAKIIVAERQ